MKRHPALAPLSRDHHHALGLAQKLRRATEDTIPAAPAITRMLEDHIRIRRDADLLARQPSLPLLHQLATQLAEHIQLEEQEVFPLIEHTIPDHDLTKLGRRLTATRPR